MRRSTQKSEALSIDGVLPGVHTQTKVISMLFPTWNYAFSLFIYITLYQNKLDLSNQEALVFILALSLHMHGYQANCLLSLDLYFLICKN